MQKITLIAEGHEPFAFLTEAAADAFIKANHKLSFTRQGAHPVEEKKAEVAPAEAEVKVRKGKKGAISAEGTDTL